MTMHLEGPWLNTGGKRKGKVKFRNSAEAQKARQLDADWKELQKKWEVDADEKKFSEAFEHFSKEKKINFTNLFGDGKAAEFICEEILLHIKKKNNNN